MAEISIVGPVDCEDDTYARVIMIELASGDFAPSGGTNLEAWLEVAE